MKYSAVPNFNLAIKKLRNSIDMNDNYLLSKYYLIFKN